MEFLKRTEEELLLLDAVDRFIEKRIKPLREAYNDVPLPKSVARQVLAELAEFGYIAGTAPESVGGYGLSNVMQGLLTERLSRAFPGLAGTAFIHSAMTNRIAMAGSKKQQDTYLQKMLNAEMIGCGAITEPDVGSNTADVSTRATRTEDGWSISGEKVWISNGNISDIASVVARTGDGKNGLSRFLVERKDGYTSRDIPKMAMNEWSTATLSFDAKVPDWRQVGDEGKGLQITLVGFQTARAYVAMLSVGIAQACLDLAIAYAQEREQWGKRIAQHQMIQEMIADMATLTDNARLLALRGLYLVDQGVRCDIQTSMAKGYATEAAIDVASKAVQIHGACGISSEFPVERYFREARLLTIPDGTTQIQKLIIGRGLTGLRAFN
ncbi:MAG: acyl-CoA/acyl-ACP dehydrogenase [Gammaproteobacteria bacterium]|nr:acyl-CoA/acyl-ACP dehydrogenase [Gammaproteobacteria bacterium]